MGPTVTSLIYIGLSLDWAVRAQMGPLPRPTLWAISSPVVSRGADVILRCQGYLGSDRFQLWKDGELREERNASWQQADFLLRNVDDWKDARSYSCRFGQGPLWSELSEALDLVVTGIFPKPSISASHGSPLYPGATATIRCDMSGQASSQDYSFALLEAKSLEPLQQQSTAWTWVDFSLPSVRLEDMGSYSCIYYKNKVPYSGSHPSNTLELTVLGQLPKPTLWAQPGLVVAPGTNITLWCSRPKLSSLAEVTFTLWKVLTHGHLQQQTSSGLWTSFILPSVRPKDAGSYSCTYREKIASFRGSMYSDYLELVVTGSLPKPSLSALPAVVVEPGIHVTLQCRQPPQTFLSGLTFTLLKMGSPQPLQRQSPAGTSADFLLLSVRGQDSGSYRCFYHRRMAPYEVSEASEVLEIWVTVPSNILLIALSCVSFLLICLLLLAFLCHRSIPIGSLHREGLRRVFCCPCLPQGVCQPHHPEAPTDEPLYTEVARGTPREPSVHMAEDLEGVTYAHLNKRTLNKRQEDPKENSTEPTVYATISLD
ncbi:immunoglobulin superfamily member 1-like isoform X2 [Notamacropus eugenii]|uniref:immunoglobulin superfamily member 1-like isoform X2 n=1 Tax=Notamacropus eugenii TaxID=9315 RepID=UPI003B67A837